MFGYNFLQLKHLFYGLVLETESHSVVQASLKLTVNPLSQSLQRWNYKHERP